MTDNTITWALTDQATYTSEADKNTANDALVKSYASSAVTAYYNSDSSKTTTATVATSTYNLMDSGAYAVAALGAGLALLAAF